LSPGWLGVSGRRARHHEWFGPEKTADRSGGNALPVPAVAYRPPKLVRFGGQPCASVR